MVHNCVLPQFYWFCIFFPSLGCAPSGETRANCSCQREANQGVYGYWVYCSSKVSTVTVTPIKYDYWVQCVKTVYVNYESYLGCSQAYRVIDLSYILLIPSLYFSVNLTLQLVVTASGPGSLQVASCRIGGSANLSQGTGHGWALYAIAVQWPDGTNLLTHLGMRIWAGRSHFLWPLWEYPRMHKFEINWRLASSVLQWAESIPNQQFTIILVLCGSYTSFRIFHSYLNMCYSVPLDLICGTLLALMWTASTEKFEAIPSHRRGKHQLDQLSRGGAWNRVNAAWTRRERLFFALNARFLRWTTVTPKTAILDQSQHDQHVQKMGVCAVFTHVPNRTWFGCTFQLMTNCCLSDAHRIKGLCELVFHNGRTTGQCATSAAKGSRPCWKARRAG